MAPYPEEVDVFTIPHSRMKNLVHNYCDMLSKTDFSNGREFEFLLNNLRNTFNEFRCHELIENKFIMKKLKRKLKELSIRNAAVCNCHKDNQLKEIVGLFRDAAEWRRRSRLERISYGVKLRTILEEFTDHFLPHMKEEEEVFQPLLMKYFSYEELRCIKTQVISEHENWNWKYRWDEKKLQESDETEEDDDLCSAENVSLPPEILVKIFAELSPNDLCRVAQVSKSWNRAALDPSLWREINPVKWAQGEWRNEEEAGEDEQGSETDSDGPDIYIKDEDADLDESAGDSDVNDRTTQSRVCRVKREWQIIQGLCRHLLPRIGPGVRVLCLAHSKSLTNGSLYRFLKLCPNLEVVNLASTRISDFGFRGMVKANGGASLRHVNLSGCSSVTDKTLERLFSNLCQNAGNGTKPCDSTSTTTKAQKDVDNKRHACERPQCRRTERSDDVVLDERTKNGILVKLETLNLSGCYKITDFGLRMIGRGHGLPYMRRLDLSGLPSISSSGLNALVLRCPNLDHEYFSYCDNITDGPMATLANGCQNVSCPSRACCRHVMEH